MLRRGVVGALIEKGSGLLAGVSVVMKDEAVEMKLRGCDRMRRVSKPQRLGARRGQPLKLADARIGALENGRGREFLAQDAHACLAHTFCQQSFGKELQNNQVAVLVYDEAGQLVSFAKAKAARVVGSVEHRFAARDGCAQARCKQFEPRGMIERVARDQPQRDLRLRTVERRAKKDPALICDRQERFFRFWQRDGYNVGCVDPEMAATQMVGGAAVHNRADGRCPRWNGRWTGSGASGR